MPVLAITAHDVIGWLQRGDGADAAGLLPDIEVQEAADLAEGIFFGRLLFEAPDQHHLIVQP